MTKSLFRHCLLALLACAVMLVLLERHSNVNLWLADAMYDFSSRNFPLRDSWFAGVLMHRWMKSLFVCLALMPLGILSIDRIMSRSLLTSVGRAEILAVALSAVLIPLIISLLKTASIHACPGMSNATAANCRISGYSTGCRSESAPVIAFPPAMHRRRSGYLRLPSGGCGITGKLPDWCSEWV